jgi:hypothetical protein
MSSTYFTDSVSDLCQGIIDKVDTYEKRIKYLEEENKKLKDEHYKDSEMQRMEAELKKSERGSVQRISNFRKRTRENQRVGIKT